MSDATHAEHAADVPVYVRAEGDAWGLIDTASDDLLSTHDTSRQACDAALEIGLAASLKRANLREEGEPIGAWRWLDATAEEDEPVGGSRITAAAIWEMSAGLNRRESAVPINGGGAPRAGLGDSVPHGDAFAGGDHLANGYAHVAVPVASATGRTHMFLRSELMPEVARETDLGRLAYGSIRFGFDEIDAADNDAIKGAVLISHALTNDPAVTTLTAGSERRREAEPAYVACRSRRMEPMATKAIRGPAMDVLKKIAATLHVEIADEMDGDSWCSPIMDAISALKGAAKVEELLGGASEETAPEPTEPPVEDTATAPRAAARAEGEEPATPDPEAMAVEHGALVDWGREVLGKPEATAAEVIEELVARKAEVGAALGTDTPEPDVEDPSVGEDSGAEERAARARAGDPAALRARADKAEAALAVESAKVLRFETREWLDGEISKRKLAVKPDRVAKWTDMAIAKGRDVALEILDAQSRPPTTHPFDSERAPSDRTPKSRAAAVSSLIEAARTELREKHKGDVPETWVSALAIARAREAFPELYETTGADGATSA